MQNVQFTAPQLARLFKVNESTVKRWIDRGLLRAVRTPGGHRRVREEDLTRFLEAQPKVRKHSYVLSRYAKQTSDNELWRTYFELHRDRHPSKAREVLTGSYVSTGSVFKAVRDVVIPALVAIGEEWRAGRLDIADEHRMTFLIRADLLALEMVLPSPQKDAPHLLLACVPEENHELALVLLALVAREQGWKTTVLGINVPVRELEREAMATRIDMVALAKAYRGATGVAYVREVRSIPALRGVPVIVGGGGWTLQNQKSMQRMDNVHFAGTMKDVCAYLERFTRSRKQSRVYAKK